MRIKIVLAPVTEPSFLPLDQYALASLIYRTVALVAPEYADFLHNEGYRSANVPTELPHKTFKLFTFSRPYLPDTLLNKGLEERAWFARGNVTWQVSSPKLEFMEALATGLISQGVVTISDRLGGAQFSVESIEEILPPPKLTEMRCTTLSPVTVSVAETDANGLRRKQFIWADDPRFGSLVAANLKEKYRALSGEESNGEVHFAFDREYLQRRGGVERVSKLVLQRDEDQSVASTVHCHGRCRVDSSGLGMRLRGSEFQRLRHGGGGGEKVMARKRKTLDKLLTAEALRTFAGAAAYERGRAYAEAGKVMEISRSDETLMARIAGTRLYEVTMWVRAGRLQYTCDCEAAAEGAFCKHCVAAGIQRERS